MSLEIKQIYMSNKEIDSIVKYLGYEFDVNDYDELIEQMIGQYLEVL